MFQKRKSTKERIQNIDSIEPQTIEIYLASDMKRELLMAGCEIKGASLQIVLEKGKGAARLVYRFKFRADATLTHQDVRNFACLHFGDSVWITMDEVNARLK